MRRDRPAPRDRRAAAGRRLSALLLALSIVAAATLSGLPAGAAAAPAETLRIGVLAPLTGPFASGGRSLVQAATLAADRANAGGGVLGRQVELVVADTQGRVDAAKSETLRLVHREGVFALVGAYLSEETIGVVEVAAASRRVVVVPVAATGEITDRVRSDYDRYRYVFRAGYSIAQWGEMTAAFLADRGVRRYAFVGTGIRWNRELAATLRGSLGRRGIVPAYEAFYSAASPAADPIAVAAARSKPDILVLGDPGQNVVAFAKRVREIAPRLPLFSVGGTLGDARVALSLPMSAPLYVQAAAWRGGSPEATEYAEVFESRYGYAPVGYSDTLPHDALALLLGAIRAAGKAEPDAVVRALENGAFPGVAGTYRFDAAHQASWGTQELQGVVIDWGPAGARVVFPHR